MADSPPDYLRSISSNPGIVAEFIGRIPGVPVHTDRHSALLNLKPFHERAILAGKFKPEELWLAEQVHGNTVAIVNPSSMPHSISGVDGLVVPGGVRCLLGIYVADCAAVWLYDHRTGALGLIHSGRKGTEGNITRAALEKMMVHFGTRPSDICAVISPCIRPPHYEVDIPAQIIRQLQEAGVKENHIQDCGICTGCDTATYYSYRMEKGFTGRMLALLGRA